MIVLLFPFGFCFTHAIQLSKDFLLLAGRGSTVSQNRRQGLNDRLERRVYNIFSSTIISQINVITIKEIQNILHFATITIACMVLQQIVIIKYEKTAFHSTHI